MGFRVRAGFFHSMEWMAGEERPWLYAAVLEEVRPFGGLTSILTFLSLAVALKSDRSEELMVNQSGSNLFLHEGRGDGQLTWIRSEARVADEDPGPALSKKGCFYLVCQHFGMGEP